MPGLIALGRRWSVGSDDLVLPSGIFFTLHFVWSIILVCILSQAHSQDKCPGQLYTSIAGYLVLLVATTVTEGVITFISLRGTILYVRPRQYIQVALYLEAVIVGLSVVWSLISIGWLADSYTKCSLHYIKQTVLGLIIFHFAFLLTWFFLIWCIWDGAGRSFVKLKQTEHERNIRRTASRVERNQQRELRTHAKYNQNWDKRLRFWFCCTSVGEEQESAYADIAVLFSEFFRDLDVVPTDVLAGMMLLREEQKQRREAIEHSEQNSVFKFLSGVPVTPETKFLDFNSTVDRDLFEEMHYYFRFAAAAYGWKGYVLMHGAKGCWAMTRECRCCCLKRNRHYHDMTSDPDADNCCMCNFAALKKMSGLTENDVIYATFHVSVSNRAADNTLLDLDEPTVTESYGFDTDGLVLVGSPVEGLSPSWGEGGVGVGGGGTTMPEWAGGGGDVGGGNQTWGTTTTATTAAQEAPTIESRFCLHPSLKFQEEMDNRMLTFDPVPSDLDRDSVSCCCGSVCSCLPCFVSSCSPACCGSGLGSAASVSSLSPSDNANACRLESKKCMSPSIDKVQLEVCETPFFVALDHERRRVVVSIRGTLSVADVMTDLSADISPIHSEDGSKTYQGHKGMIEAANYIRRRLIDDLLLHQAFTANEEQGTQNYQLLLVGHSLGAGTAAILGIMLRPSYPSLKVYAYSPPGGLLCKAAAEYAAEFVTSLVVGKDVIARIGLPQMEFLRSDLVNCIKMCRDPKWRVIFGELLCCCQIRSKNLAPIEDVDAPSPFPCRLNKAHHPTNQQLVLTTHAPLYLPGRVLQIVRNNPKREGISKKDCAYYGIWRGLEDFSEVLISPVMIKDHMPGGVMNALDKCLEYGRRHGIPKTWSQVGRTPMMGRSPPPDPAQPPSSSSSLSSCLQMKSVSGRDKEGPHVRFQDSPSKSSQSSQSWRSGQKVEANNNHHNSELPATPEEQLPFLPQSQGTSGSKPAAEPFVPVSNSSIEGAAAAHKPLAPLASSESMTDPESARSSLSSTSFSSVLQRYQNGSPTRDQGYCYYVENQSPPTNLSASNDDVFSSAANAMTTTAMIESVPSLSDDHLANGAAKPSPNLIGPWNLFRSGSNTMLDEEGNVRGRTSADDRYTLTYAETDADNTMSTELGTDSQSTPHSNIGDSISSTYLPEAKLGHGYTEYLSFQDTGFNTDDDIDEDILFDSLHSQLYGNENHVKDRKSFTLPAGSVAPSNGSSYEESPKLKHQRRRSLDTTSSSTLTPGSLQSLRSKEEVEIS